MRVYTSANGNTQFVTHQKQQKSWQKRARMKLTLHLLFDKHDQTLSEGDDPAVHVVTSLLYAAFWIHKLRLLLLHVTEPLASATNHHISISTIFVTEYRKILITVFVKPRGSLLSTVNEMNFCKSQLRIHRIAVRSSWNAVRSLLVSSD